MDFTKLLKLLVVQCSCICVSGTVGPRADGDTGQLDTWMSGFCTPSAFSSVAMEAI